MWELIDIAIPNIMPEWEALAFCLRYTPGEVESFRKDSKSLNECCLRTGLPLIMVQNLKLTKTY